MIDSTEIIKYLVYGIVVYLLLTFVPKNKLVLEDKLICTAVVIISVIGLSVIKTKNTQEHFDNSTPTSESVFNTAYDAAVNVLTATETPTPSPSRPSARQVLVWRVFEAKRLGVLRSISCAVASAPMACSAWHVLV